MKLTIATIITLLFSAFAYAESYEAEGNMRQVAQKLQSELPKYAKDGLVEAERKSGYWGYSFWVDFDKTWVKEVSIELDYINAYKTKITVSATKTTGGLISKSKDKLPGLKQEWSQKVKTILPPNQCKQKDC